MALPTTNITITAAKNAISETTYALRQLCISSKINQWALHKPANYGAGNNAWTVDSGQYSGYKQALSISTDSVGHRLGDFRGYNHSAGAPLYFSGNKSYSYYKYEIPSGTIEISNGEMFYTSSGNGFAPAFHTLDDTSNTLTSVRLNIAGVDQATGIELVEARNAVLFTGITKKKGTHILKAYYYTRLSDISNWQKANEIEGGSVSLVVTELAAKFTISNTTIVPSSTTAGTETFQVSFRVNNSTSSAISYTFYWQMSNKNGYVSINVAASSYSDYSVQVFEAATSTPSETWLLKMTNSSGQTLDNSVKDITVT